MELDRMHRHLKAGRNLLIRKPERGDLEHLDLACREPTAPVGFVTGSAGSFKHTSMLEASIRVAYGTEDQRFRPTPSRSARGRRCDLALRP